MKKIICLILLMSFSLPSYSWDGAITGKINTVDVAPGTNLGFRVSLSGAPAICGSAATWAYLNNTDSNYETFVSVMLAAKMADRAITIYTTKIGSLEYCKIGYISLQ